MTTEDRERRPGALLGWLLALSLALWALGRLGHGALASPPVGDLDALASWYGARAPAEILLAGVRLLVLALGWYLLAVTVVGAVARLLRAARLVAVTDAVTVPMVRRTLQAALGVGLAAATATSLPLAAGQGLRPAAAEAAEQGTDASALPTLASDPAPILSAASEDGEAPPTLRAVSLDTPSTPSLPVDHPAGLPGVAVSSPGETAAEPPSPEEGSVEQHVRSQDEQAAEAGDATGAAVAPGADLAPEDDTVVAGASHHTIEPGEHLWSVAEQALAAAWGKAPSDAEVAPYWRQLIDDNRAQLPDPGNPDLVHPGLSVALPETPAP